MLCNFLQKVLAKNTPPVYFALTDDLDKRFPGVEWFCDRCGARLDHQPGFDDHLRVWKCKKCGYKNPIEITEIYDTDEDWLEKRSPVDPDDFYRALKRRSDELDGESENR